jgi:hypothetical protein
VLADAGNLASTLEIVIVNIDKRIGLFFLVQELITKVRVNVIFLSHYFKSSPHFTCVIGVVRFLDSCF